MRPTSAFDPYQVTFNIDPSSAFNSPFLNEMLKANRRHLEQLAGEAMAAEAFLESEQTRERALQAIFDVCEMIEAGGEEMGAARAGFILGRIRQILGEFYDKAEMVKRYRVVKEQVEELERMLREREAAERGE